MRRVLVLLIFISELFFTSSCKKEDPAQLPIVSTTPATNITVSTATSGGTITDDGGATVTANGVCWSTNTNPSINDSKTVDGGSIGQFVSNLSGLSGGTTYHIRAYATNSVGTAYGADMSFVTLGQSPVGLTQPSSGISATGATLNGTVNPNYLSTTVTFEYGTTTSYGQAATAIQSPITGNSITNVSVAITGLTAGSTYHFRIKTVNSLGTTYGDDMTFTTSGSAPSSVTQAACCLSTTSATLNGVVNANYLTTAVTFEYGTTTAYGNSIAANQSPLTGNTNTNVSARITGLASGTTYHFRIKAENSLGTTYGSDMTFITNTPPTTVTDIDGNIYNTVTIGTQVWMKENLKTTKYRNGELIGTTTPATLNITSVSTPKYQWAYGGNENNVITYGRLYTWYAITDSRGLCPTGWHVPTDSEWTILTEYLTNNNYGYQGSGSDIGKSMAATSGWRTDSTPGNVGNDQSSNNSSGFTALPGGSRWDNGTFVYIGDDAYWWCNSEYPATFSRYMNFYSGNVSRVAGTGVTIGGVANSVRCIRD